MTFLSSAPVPLEGFGIGVVSDLYLRSSQHRAHAQWGTELALQGFDVRWSECGMA